MPYYRWYGIDITGTTCRGVSFARTEKELSQFLFEYKQIALIAAAQRGQWLVRHAGALKSHRIGFYKHCAVLLNAGLKITQVLKNVTRSSSHHHLQEVLYALMMDISEGKTVAAAMQHYPWVFGDVCEHMVAVGEQTGDLAAALLALAEYELSVELFSKNIKRVVLLPALTFGFFILVAAFILVVIVPQFNDIFTQLHKEIPVQTQWLMHVGMFLRQYGLLLLVIMGIGAWLFARIMSRPSTRMLVDGLVLRLPIVQTIVTQRAIHYFAKALGMLLQAGVPQLSALAIASYVVENRILQAQLNNVAQRVAQGYSLSDAMQSEHAFCAQDDVVSLLAVGAESGQLPQMLFSVAQVYQQHVERVLNLISMVLQPMLMVILGFLIVGMIIALYMPLFTIADIA